MKDKEFEHIAPMLRRRSVATARSLGLDADDAEDVAQDALLKRDYKLLFPVNFLHHIKFNH